MLHYYLPNGIEVVLKQNHFAKMVAVQCWVRAGSMHEREHERGMAHVLEHMLFKGTKKRAVGEISRTVEACGGEINAYTTFDRTVYYLTMASKHDEEAVELLSDAIINSSFDSTELERELEVIIEEIKRGNDSPGSKVGRKIFEKAFAGTEAARPIIGYENEVRGFKRQNLVDFHDRWYRPRNMMLVIVGDFDVAKMRSYVEKYFGGLADRAVDQMVFPPRTAQNKSEAILLHGDYQQPRLELVFRAPKLEHPDTASLDLAAFALGSGESSRFARSLRDEKELVTGASAAIYTPDFGGIFEVSLHPTLETYLPSIRETGAELARLITTKPINEDELSRARANLRSDRVYQEETVSGQARALGHGLTTSHKLLFDDVYMALIEKTPPTIVNEAARRWLDLNSVVIVGMVPPGSEITEKAMLDAFQEGVQSVLKQKSADTPTIAPEATTKRLKPEVKEIFPGLKFVYRQNPEAQLFGMVMVAHGGLRGETEANSGIYSAATSLLAKATTTHSYDALLAIVEGKGAAIDGFSGKDSFGLKLHCLADQANDFIKLLFDCALNPVFPKQQWQVLKRETLEDIRTQDDSPSGVCIRKFQELLFVDHPYRFPVHGTKESVEGMTEESLLKFYVAQRDQMPWVIAATGPQTMIEVEALIRAAMGPWRPKGGFIDFAAAKAAITVGKPNEAHIHKDREQTHIVIGFNGLSWFDQDRPAMDVMAAVLGGSGGRLFTNLRDKDSLAYSVSPLVSYGFHPGVAGAYIACAPEKVDRAKAAMIKELELLTKESISDDELARAINYLVGSHESDMQRGDSQVMTMGLMELYGVGHDDFLRYPSRIEAVTKADVQKVARKVFAFDRRISVTVGA